MLVMSVNPGFGGQSFIASQLAQDRGDPQAHRQGGPAPSTSRSTAASMPAPRGGRSRPAPMSLVAGTATFRGGAGPLCRQHRRAARMSLLEKIDPARGERDRAGQEADPGRRRPGRLARRASLLDPPPPVLANPLPRPSPARPGVRSSCIAVPKDPVAGDKAAGEAILQGRFVRGGETVEAETPRLRGSARLGPGPRPGLSAELRMASRPRRRRDPRAGRQAGREDRPQMARGPCRGGDRAGLARRPVGPADALLDRLRALHPLEPRFRLSGAGAQHPVARRPASRQGRREGAAGPRPDHRLGGGDRRGPARPGRAGAAQPRRGRAAPRAGRLASRRRRAAQPLADRAGHAGRAARPAARRLLCRRARHARGGRRRPVGRRRPLCSG